MEARDERAENRWRHSIIGLLPGTGPKLAGAGASPQAEALR